jgi:hypothetical protein
MSNIEPLARAITERVCRATPSPGSATDDEVAAWVDSHWESAAAELEAGTIDDAGQRAPGSNWELGLAAYIDRMAARRNCASTVQS